MISLRFNISHTLLSSVHLPYIVVRISVNIHDLWKHLTIEKSFHLLLSYGVYFEQMFGRKRIFIWSKVLTNTRGNSKY